MTPIGACDSPQTMFCTATASVKSAAVTAVFTVAFLMRYFKRGNLIPFGIYCIVFGAAMVVYNA